MFPSRWQSSAVSLRRPLLRTSLLPVSALVDQSRASPGVSPHFPSGAPVSPSPLSSPCTARPGSMNAWEMDLGQYRPLSFGGAAPEPSSAGGILGTVSHPEGGEKVADTQRQEAPAGVPDYDMVWGVLCRDTSAEEEPRTRQSLGPRQRGSSTRLGGQARKGTAERSAGGIEALDPRTQ